MGQKINPIGLRLGINRTWDSRWYSDGAATMPSFCMKISSIREYLREPPQAGRHQPDHHRASGKPCRVTIYSARPGVVIGKKGADIEKLRQACRK
jgi:small subunit ribosomal protein S3